MVALVYVAQKNISKVVKGHFQERTDTKKRIVNVVNFRCAGNTYIFKSIYFEVVTQTCYVEDRFLKRNSATSLGMYYYEKSVVCKHLHLLFNVLDWLEVFSLDDDMTSKPSNRF